jgi:hypothetical protein
MKYYIQRQLSEYGPYTLADLQRYVAQGSILLTDLTRSEGMTGWVPVSQVIGNIPAPQPAGVMQAPASGAANAFGTAGTVYGGPGSVPGGAPAYGGNAAMYSGPVPLDLHWGLVLLIGVFTCGLFLSAWLIVEALWIRKIKPDSVAFLFVIFGVAFPYIGRFMTGFSQVDPNPFGLLVLLLGVILYFVGVFKMRSDLEEYYNSIEPINLQLSGGMTFFFAVYYFQHHFSRIAQWKKSGVLQPQG